MCYRADLSARNFHAEAPVADDTAVLSDLLGIEFLEAVFSVESAVFLAVGEQCEHRIFAAALFSYIGKDTILYHTCAEVFALAFGSYCKGFDEPGMFHKLFTRTVS